MYCTVKDTRGYIAVQVGFGYLLVSLFKRAVYFGWYEWSPLDVY